MLGPLGQRRPAEARMDMACLGLLALLYGCAALAQTPPWWTSPRDTARFPRRDMAAGRGGVEEPLLSMPLTGDCSCSAVDGLTFTRASSGTCTNAAGTVVTCSSNQPRTTAQGLLVEESRTNVALRSEAFDNAAWVASSGAVTTSANSHVAPDGTTTMDTVTKTAALATDFLRQYTALTSTGSYSASVWVRSVSGTSDESAGLDCVGGSASACTCTASSGSCTTASAGAVCAAYVSVTTTPVRLAVSATCTAPAGGVHVFVAPGRWSTDTSASGVFWGGQLEAGSFATSYIATAGTSVTRAADVASVANPLSGTAPAAWCVGGTIAPFSSWPSSNYGLAGAGTTANTFYLRNSSGKAQHVVTDSGGSLLFVTSTANIPAAGGRIVGRDNSGTLSVCIDGACETPAPAGVGTGIITTQPATFSVGNTGSGGTPLNGYLRNLTIDNTAGGCL